MRSRTLHCVFWGTILQLGSVFAAADTLPRTAGVAITRDAEWAPGELAREGAGEFSVYLQVAQLQKTHGAAGIVAIGDRNGHLACGGEQALRRVVLTGVAVVKLAAAGQRATVDHTLFLDGGLLSSEAASDILCRCLQRHGAPPTAANPEAPTTRELAAIRSHLKPFQAALSQAAGALARN